MKQIFVPVLCILFLAAFAHRIEAQALEICTRAGGAPSLGESWGAIPYIFGKVIVTGLETDEKLPKIRVGFSERGRPEQRIIVDRTGNYCFRRTAADLDALVVVYLESSEVARREISGFGPAQQREDFEVAAREDMQNAPPGTINAKYSYPVNEKTSELYHKALEAEKSKDQDKLLDLVKEIVALDPADFNAWAKLGSLYFERKSFAEAEAAYQRALALKSDYVPAMTSLGRVYLARVKSEQAIAIGQRAVAADPASGRAYQVLGNAYLQARKGSLGVEALNKAIELDPIGMAESHLMLAILYDRAGAKDLASHEYRQFLKKVPDHPDRKKYEKYIKDNPESTNDR